MTEPGTVRHCFECGAVTDGFFYCAEHRPELRRLSPPKPGLLSYRWGATVAWITLTLVSAALYFFAVWVDHFWAGVFFGVAAIKFNEAASWWRLHRDR